MKKRIGSLILVVLMVWQTVMTCGIAVSAATVLTITSPEDGEWVSYLDAPDLEWEAVDGVAGYRVSIQKLTTNEHFDERKMETKTKFLWMVIWMQRKPSTKYG